MSWVKIDDGFEDNAKVALIGDAAHRLWFRVSCWSHKQQNAHTRGFVPEILLKDISRGLSKKKLKTLSTELVNANAGGTKEFGLWEEKDGGFQIHDWHQYRAKEPMTRSESASIAGKKSAEKRRANNGTAQPGKRKESSNNPNEPRPFDSRSSNGPRTSFDPNESRTSRTPVPVPVPVNSKDADEILKLPTQETISVPKKCQFQNLRQALMVPIRERVDYLIAHPEVEAWCEPHKWPEVIDLAKSFSAALGWHDPRFVKPSKTSNRMVELLAAYDTQELTQAVKEAPGDRWLNSDRKGLTALTVEVVGRLLNQQKPELARGQSLKRQPDYDGENDYSAAKILQEEDEEC